MISKNLKDILKVKSLFRHEAYVAGKWVSATNEKVFSVEDPSTKQIIGHAPDMGKQDTEAAIQAAQKAFTQWRNTTAKERSLFLRRWYDLMVENVDDLSSILTAETGKPLAESKGEVLYGASYIDWFAEEAKRIYGEVAQSPVKSKEMIFTREPIGVVGMITPWNFPNAMLVRKAAAAIASGCTCVGKPAEDTPFSALAVAALAEEAAIPKGVFNIVTSSRENARHVGQTLCESKNVAGLSFTGSTTVGKILYGQCASSVKRVSLELGGNAPFVVFDSCNVEAAVNGLMAAKFRNAGQTCISANRVFIQDGIYDEFLDRIIKAIKTKLIVGNGFSEGVTLGPLINQTQLNKVDSIVQQSINEGAKLLMGGKKHSLGGLFYEPTVLVNCTASMTCFSEEIFGPVLPIKKFRTEEEVIAEVNDCYRGLASYFYSQDVSQVFRVCRQIESGMIGVNEGAISTAEVPFGGIKESGFGREGSKHGIDEYTNIKYVCIGGI